MNHLSFGNFEFNKVLHSYNTWVRKNTLEAASVS